MLKESPEAKQKAKQIKAIIFDVDGVLTDSGIWFDRHSNEFKRFNAKDGFIVKPLQKYGFIVGAITGKDSDTTMYRCNELGLDFHYHGPKDKAVNYHQAKEKFKLTDEQVCYIGDDIQDLSILGRCGLSACPLDARMYIQDRVDLVTRTRGGQGVLRDVADFVLQEQGLFDKLLQTYLSR